MKTSRLGVKIETNVVIGKTLTIDDLFAQGFEAVFHRQRCRPAQFYAYPRRKSEGRIQRQRIPDAYQPDEGVYLENSRTPIQKAMPWR